MKPNLGKLTLGLQMSSDFTNVWWHAPLGGQTKKPKNPLSALGGRVNLLVVTQTPSKIACVQNSIHQFLLPPLAL